MKFEDGAVVVETGKPDAFYARLTELAASGEYGAIEEVTSPDDNLQAVFQLLPFADGTFDALTFTYLVRYVDDPAATLRELARVVRPGGSIASLEFHVPQQPMLRAGWYAYTRGVLPVLGSFVSPQWRRTGELPRAEHQPARGPRTAARAGAVVAGGGHPSRALEGADARRRRGHLGSEGRPSWGIVRAGPRIARRSTRWRPAAGATSGACCTRRTRSGTCRTW